jgi:hypothetical protein
MSDRRDLLGGGLEVDLVELGRSLAFPAPAPDFASRVTQRISSRPAARPWWRGQSLVFGRPVRRALLVAVALLLVLAAVAGAVGLGLPGLRIIFGIPPGASPPPSASPASAVPSASGTLPGDSLGLGQYVAFEQLDQAAGFHVLRPGDPAVGPPDAAYVDALRANQVSLVWTTRPGIPATLEPGVGLLFTQYDGRLDNGFVTKALGSGTTVEPVRVNGREGYWVSGEPHFFFYTARNGQFVDDSRRWVGDALLWSDGIYTYRLETSLGREAAIRIAESVR